MATSRGIYQIGKQIKENGDFTIGEGRYKYGKGEKLDEPCGDQLEVEVLVRIHGFQDV